MDQKFTLGSNPRKEFSGVVSDFEELKKLIESLMMKSRGRHDAVLVEVTLIPTNCSSSSSSSKYEFKPSTLERAVIQEISNIQLGMTKRPTCLIKRALSSKHKDLEITQKQKPSKVKRATITFKHVIIDGAKYYKFVSFENIYEYHELPSACVYGDYYFHAFRPVTMRGKQPGTPRLLIHSTDQDRSPNGTDTLVLIPGETYSPEIMSWVVRVMNKSSKKLKQINRTITQLKNNWNGREDVIEF